MPDGEVLFVEAARHELGWNLRANPVYNFPNRIPLKLLGLENPWSGVDVLGELASAAEAHRMLKFDLSLLPTVWIAKNPHDLETFYQPTVCNVGEPCKLHFVRGAITFVDDPPTVGLASKYAWAERPKSKPFMGSAKIPPDREGAYRYMFISEIYEKN